MSKHLLQHVPCLGSMRAFYDAHSMIPTSTNADVALIRSHIAYHSGAAAAERAAIKASRGHWYRVAPHGKHSSTEIAVRIIDYYDHRAGVLGWTS